MKLFVWSDYRWMQVKFTDNVEEIVSSRKRLQGQGYCTCLVKG